MKRTTSQRSGGGPPEEKDWTTIERADSAIERATAHAIGQYQGAVDYIKSLGVDTPIHIGETGWASIAADAYGTKGSQAADEYKASRYYEAMREWTNSAGISCFYFEAFDECWKDLSNKDGSENHFGLLTLQGEAKHSLWDLVDAGAFDGLTRDGNRITKTYDGNVDALNAAILRVPLQSELAILKLDLVNPDRSPGQPVTESRYVVTHQSLAPSAKEDSTYPSAPIKLNIWEGTCNLEMTQDRVIQVTVGLVQDSWWGCGLLYEGGSENLTSFRNGQLHFEMRGDTQSTFQVGFQSGNYVAGNQVNNFVTFGSESDYSLTSEWTTYAFPIATLDKGAELEDVTSAFYIYGPAGGDGKKIEIRNIFYSK